MDWDGHLLSAVAQLILAMGAFNVKKNPLEKKLTKNPPFINAFIKQIDILNTVFSTKYQANAMQINFDWSDSQVLIMVFAYKAIYFNEKRNFKIW